MYVCIYMYICTFIHIHLREDKDISYRVAKTHRIPYLYRSFSAKLAYI